MGLPPGLTANDPSAPFNPPLMTEWADVMTDVCERCDELTSVDDNYRCETCFEPEEFDLDCMEDED